MGWRVFAAFAVTACVGEIRAPPDVAPPGSPPAQPPPATDAPATCTTPPAVGRTGLHRLSGLEYDLTVERVFGELSRPSRQFPPEAAAALFDHVTDVQSVSRLHAARYEEAADAVARGVWAREFDLGMVRRFEPGPFGDGGIDSVNGLNWGTQYVNAARTFYRFYRLYVLTELDRAADYEIGFEGWAQGPADAGLPDGGERPRFWRLHLDNQLPFYTAPVTGTPGQHTVHRAVVHIDDPGLHRIDLSVADPLDPPNCEVGQSPATGCEPFDPEVGRAGAIWVSRASSRVDGGTPRVRRCELSASGACVRTTLERLGRNAYRRPLAPDELDRLVTLFLDARGAGDTVEEAFTQTVTAMLMSAHFLFEVQADPDLRSTAPHRLGAHELAARLSYFLTRGPPDDALAARADDGTLVETAVLQAETARLLADAASGRMVESFGEQLLSSRDLERAAPSSALFPAFSPALGRSMAEEARLLFQTVFTSARPVSELVDARYTFLDDALAGHYGLPAPGSAAPVRVALTTPERGGVLGLGSVLTVTSTATRPSPVKRGVWVLGHLMCDEPPPPPANIPALVDPSADALQAHTSNPYCMSCHRVIDPIGLALEHYDADGSHRDVDRQGHPILAVGTLPDGGRVEGLAGLRSNLSADPRFTACMAEHLLVYALARRPTPDDRCLAGALSAGDAGVGFHDLVHALVGAEAFRSRQPEGEVGP